MLNIGGSTSPWKNPCMSKLSDSELRDTMCTRWEEDNIPRCVCVVAICQYIPALYVIFTFIAVLQFSGFRAGGTDECVRAGGRCRGC